MTPVAIGDIQRTQGTRKTCIMPKNHYRHLLLCLHKHFKTRKHKVMTSPKCVYKVMTSTNVCLINIHFLVICSNQKAVFVGGLPNIMNIYSKPSCNIIIICFPDKTILILLDCFTQLLQIQRLAMYHR